MRADRIISALFSAVLAGAGLAACGPIADQFCDGEMCRFTDEEWSRLSSLTGLGTAPPDRSNRYVGVEAAEQLGLRFYFDTRFSGNASLVDTIGRPRVSARAAKGEPININCATCHDPARAGSDETSTPNHVSIGAGWYDVNSQPTRNSAYYHITYWNGRSDSLWSQALAVTESGVSMNGDRVRVAHVIADSYAADYAAVFPEYPLPFTEKTTELAARLDASGIECLRDAGRCPTELGCSTMQNYLDFEVCVPRFPLRGKAGRDATTCKFGDPTEPYNDAYDCMKAEDKKAVTRVLVNYAKALGAYEYRLVSKDSDLDKFVAEGPGSDQISDAAVRGAKLFVGKASCIDCHNTALMSDNLWHNVAVPQLGDAVPRLVDCPKGAPCDCVTPKNCLPFGIFDGFSKLRTGAFNRTSEWSDDPSDDTRQALYELELGDKLKGAWRTPSLRDIAITAPYMHNGFYGTLEDVVHHYNIGGRPSDAVGTPSVRLQPLGLTALEERDLVAFLRTLTGEPLPAELVRPGP